MSKARVRPPDPDDIAAIARISADAVRNGTATFEIEPPGEAEIARRQRALVANNYPYLIVEQAGAVAGYAYVGPYHARPAYRWSVENTIYVAPELHRRGLGRLLMTRLIADAETRGFRQMIGVVGDGTNTASIALHAAVGFRRIRSLQSVGFKHGRWLDIVVMQRPLGAADATPP
jgi:L-amino acid N-acyltransferase YncA